MKEKKNINIVLITKFRNTLKAVITVLTLHYC